MVKGWSISLLDGIAAHSWISVSDFRAGNLSETQSWYRFGVEQHGWNRKMRSTFHTQSEYCKHWSQVHHTEMVIVTQIIQRNSIQFTPRSILKYTQNETDLKISQRFKWPKWKSYLKFLSNQKLFAHNKEFLSEISILSIKKMIEWFALIAKDRMPQNV